ncbi:MAG TPA: hypothetical protein VGG41_09335 [Solirubrobacteraceae bacterium]
MADYHDLLSAELQAKLSAAPSSQIEQGRRIQTYLMLDRERWDTIAQTDAGLVVLDRCHLSLMAYTIALEPWIGSVARRESLERIQSALTLPMHPMRQPDVIVYLAMSAEVASLRCRELATTMPPRLRSVTFTQRLIDAYEQVLVSVAGRVVRCSSEQPLDDLHAEVLSVLESLAP